MVNSRSQVFGSKRCVPVRERSRCAKVWASTGSSSSARGVGTSPRPRRTKSGSWSTPLNRASPLLTAGAVTFSFFAAPVTLRSVSTA